MFYIFVRFQKAAFGSLKGRHLLVGRTLGIPDIEYGHGMIMHMDSL